MGYNEINGTRENLVCSNFGYLHRCHVRSRRFFDEHIDFIDLRQVGIWVAFNMTYSGSR